MRQVADEEGRTVLFVSHNLASVQFLCDRTIYLENGSVAFDGDTDEAIEYYLGRAAIDHPEVEDVGVFDLARAARHHDARLPVLQRAMLLAGEGRTTDAVPAGGRLDLRVHLSHLEQVPDPSIILRILNDQDQLLCRMATKMRPLELGLDGPLPSDGELAITVPSLPLTPGHYTIEALVRDGDSNEVVDHVRAAAAFSVLPSDYFGSGYVPQPKDGAFLLDWRWELRTELGATGRAGR
jgi:lipopolysaccharide transport system ATP-binding protein